MLHGAEEHVPGSMTPDYQDEVQTTLCPRVYAIQGAPCDILVHGPSLTSLLRTNRTLIATANATRDEVTCEVTSTLHVT